MQDQRELWTPPTGVTLLPFRRHVETDEIIELPDGRRARRWIDDSRTVTQIEHNDTLDAIVRPRTVTIKFGRNADG